MDAPETSPNFAPLRRANNRMASPPPEERPPSMPSPGRVSTTSGYGPYGFARSGFAPYGYGYIHPSARVESIPQPATRFAFPESMLHKHAAPGAQAKSMPQLGMSLWPSQYESMRPNNSHPGQAHRAVDNNPTQGDNNPTTQPAGAEYGYNHPYYNSARYDSYEGPLPPNFEDEDEDEDEEYYSSGGDSSFSPSSSPSSSSGDENDEHNASQEDDDGDDDEEFHDSTSNLGFQEAKQLLLATTPLSSLSRLSTLPIRLLSHLSSLLLWYTTTATTTTLTRFLADFTLGFADGLTVPFALTAGLSSLGQSHTVILAGLTEICAGCFSMGMGGYVAAKGERDAVRAEREGKGKGGGTTAARYLEPLALPLSVYGVVIAHVLERGYVLERLEAAARDSRDARAASPVVVGLSVALGYLLGGLLPVLPYFFVVRAEDGLAWSFGVNLVASFLFGFAKHFFTAGPGVQGKTGGVPWRHVGRSAWEGALMAIVGGLSAVLAVVCVKGLEGAHGYYLADSTSSGTPS